MVISVAVLDGFGVVNTIIKLKTKLPKFTRVYKINPCLCACAYTIYNIYTILEFCFNNIETSGAKISTKINN